MRKDEMTPAELDAVAGGEDRGGVAGVRGVTDAELDHVGGGDDRGGVAGVRGLA